MEHCGACKRTNQKQPFTLTFLQHIESLISIASSAVLIYVLWYFFRLGQVPVP